MLQLWSMDQLHQVGTLTAQQRRLADSIVVCICRGSYKKALRELNYLAGLLPAAQEHAVRQLLQRLQRRRKTDSLLACEMLARQLPQVDVVVIDSIDTHMPRPFLAEIYAHLLQLGDAQLEQQLQHWQWVEHTVLRHTLILYVHCTRLQAAQRALDKLEVAAAKFHLELRLLYTLILASSLYLLSFFF